MIDPENCTPVSKEALCTEMLALSAMAGSFDVSKSEGCPDAHGDLEAIVEQSLLNMAWAAGLDTPSPVDMVFKFMEGAGFKPGKEEEGKKAFAQVKAMIAGMRERMDLTDDKV